MYFSGCVAKRKKQGLFEYQLKSGVTNVENVQMSLKANLKFNFPAITPTWNASTWAYR